MPILDGSVGFESRKTAGVPLTIPYEKNPTDTAQIHIASPVVRNAADTQFQSVTLPANSTNTAGGHCTANKLLGFSNTTDRLTRAADLGMQFAQFPGANRPDGNEEILVEVADGTTEFFMALLPTIAPTVAMQATMAGLTLNAQLQYCLDPTYTTNAPIMILRIPADQIGVLGGKVQCVIPAANSQYLTPGN